MTSNAELLRKIEILDNTLTYKEQRMQEYEDDIENLIIVQDELLRVLEHVHWQWWEGTPELPEEYGRFVCILCQGEKPDDTKDCPIGKVLQRART